MIEFIFHDSERIKEQSTKFFINGKLSLANEVGLVQSTAQ